VFASSGTQPRFIRLRWWLAGVCLGVFTLLVFYRLVFGDRTRFLPTLTLMEELAGATLIEDPLPDTVLDWPQWRGPLRLGFTRQPDLLLKWPEKGPPVLWRSEGGDGYSSFAVREGWAYSMVLQGDGKEAVVCWNAHNGKERWRHSYDPGADFAYGGPRATPTVDGQLLYTLSAAGNLMCLESATGKVRWEFDFPTRLKAVAPKWGFACSPLLEDNRVFVMPGGAGHGLAALDKNTGELLWTSEDDLAGYSSAVAVEVGGVRQIVFFTAKRLLGVDPRDGKLLWEFPWVTDFDVNAATPLPIKASRDGKELNYVFISSGYRRGSALVRIGGGKDGFQAEVVFETNELCCHFASPVRRGQYLYGLDETRQLTCLNLRSGQVMWRESGFQKGSLLRVEDHLIVLSEDGKLVLVETNPDRYTEKARCRPFRTSPCWTMPILAEGRLYLRDKSRILCLDLRSGHEPEP
jgi:hypothetical protein